MAAIGLVVADAAALTPADQIEADLIEALGHDLEAKTAATSGLVAWAESKDLVVIATSATPALIGTHLRDADVPLIVVGTNGTTRWSDFGMGPATSNGSNTTWRVLTPWGGTAVVAGIAEGAFAAYSSTAARSYFAAESGLPVGTEKLAHLGTDPTRIVYFRIPAGTTLLHGTNALQPRYGISGHAEAVELYSIPPVRWRDVFSAAVTHALPAGPPPVPAPSVTITGEEPFPVGTPEQLEAVVDLNGGSAIASITWTAPGLTITGGTTLTPSVTAPVAGSYTATVLVTNADGKTAEASIVLEAVDYLVPAGPTRAVWDGTALVEVRARVLYTGDGQGVNLTDGSLVTWPLSDTNPGA